MVIWKGWSLVATEFTAGFLFCGLGAGARGFLDEAARLGPATAAFRSLGGVDIDAEACADFEMLTGSPAVVADLSTMQPADLLKAWGLRRPDAIFLSPPCKGFSGLLSAANSKRPKYQALNQLVLQGLFLACETWESPPPIIVLENVPRIQSRGADLLSKAKQLLSRYGYVFHTATHDCGEIGGLAQHRKRFLLIARRPDDVPGYIYRPPTKRVRGCGEVLETLPMPEDPSSGQLHKLPALSWLNWVRLALIPAGGDWRDLPKGPVQVMQDETKHRGRPDAYGVQKWEKPAKAVRGNMRVHHSPAAVADPRLCTPVQEGEERRAHFKRYHIARWYEAVRTVAGSGTNGNYGVADPRPKFNGRYGVVPWGEPMGAVAGENLPSNGKFSVADPRVIDASLKCTPRSGAYGVMRWDEAASTITGSMVVDNRPAAVADPRHPDGVATVPVIISEDGTWHRPLTTLELAALQGIPAVINGQPLKLAGKSVARWRERIGNAVPVQAAAAIAKTILTALLAGHLGTWMAGSGGVWVDQHGRTEDDVNREYEVGNESLGGEL
jgi:site-specific DNA-cytosine methylase